MAKPRKRRQSTSWIKRSIARAGISMVDLVMLTKHLSVMVGSGLTTVESLETIAEQATGRLKRVLERVHKRVDGGSSLGDALAMDETVFGPVFVSAAVVGENSGTLAENLERLATQMEKDLHLRRQIQSAVMYPVIILSAAVFLGLGIGTFVLPQIVHVFSSLNTELPFTTRALIYIAEIFDAYGIWISVGFLLGVMALIVLLRQPFLRPITHRILVNLPSVRSFVQDLNRARFCRTLGTLLESGTPITEALSITESIIPNVVYKKSVQDLRQKIGSGESFFEIIEQHGHLYPSMISRMVRIGEESGELGETLTYLASFYEERVEVMAKNLSSLIEPFLLISIGLLVALIAISVITPIYSITSSITI